MNIEKQTLVICTYSIDLLAYLFEERKRKTQKKNETENAHTKRVRWTSKENQWNNLSYYT